jgi:hypothetical protein
MVAKRDPWIKKKMDAACRMADRKGGREFLYDASQHYRCASWRTYDDALMAGGGG